MEKGNIGLNRKRPRKRKRQERGSDKLNLNKEVCSECGHSDEDEEDWVECESCGNWYHASCTNLNYFHIDVIQKMDWACVFSLLDCKFKYLTNHFFSKKAESQQKTLLKLGNLYKYYFAISHS